MGDRGAGGDWLVPRALPSPRDRAGGRVSPHLWPRPGPEQRPPSQPFTQQEIIGFVIGSVSSVLYLLSRLPQIRTNVSLGPGQGVLRVKGWGLGAEGLGSNSPLAWASESSSPALGFGLCEVGTGEAGLEGHRCPVCVSENQEVR